MKKFYRMKQLFNRNQRGYTIMELLIIICIIASLLIIGIMSYMGQVKHGLDARRKDDLNNIRIAFEEYYTDKGCYPPLDVLDTCGGAGLQPYLKEIPCDPETKLPYEYKVADAADPTNVCRGFRVFTSLGDTTDTDILRIGCSGVTGCGYESEWNYGVSAGVPITAPGFNHLIPPTSTPATGQYWACVSVSGGGNCNEVGIGSN